VNVAAISYYFRSKDDLVALVLERALDRGVKDPLVDFDRLADAGKDARIALAGAIEGFLESAVRFPRTVVAQLHGPIVMQDYRRDVVVRMNALLDRLFARLQKRLVGRGAAQKRATLAQLWSAVVMAAIAPMLLRPFGRTDLREAKQRRAWVSALVNRSLVEAPKARRRGGRRSSRRSGSGRRRR
jgi:AcrR family transcriptional regulator